MAFDPAESAAGVLRGWLRAMLAHPHGSEVYQTSTMGALLDGVYDGDVTIRELLRHGDFGLGTFNGLDGEMLVSMASAINCAGTAVRVSPIRSNARPSPWSPGLPPTVRFDVSETATAPSLKARIDESLPSTNLIVAVRITGNFSVIRFAR